MSNKKSPGGGFTVQLNVRVDAELVKRIDLHAKRLQAAEPWRSISQADAARHLLLKALNEAELARSQR